MMKTSFVLRSVLLLLVVGVGAVCGEVFTALVHMEGLLELEGELLASLNSYITAERQRLSVLEKFADRVQLAKDAVGRDPKGHLFDPVNIFHLINRYANGWMDLNNDVYTDNMEDLMANISLNSHRFPEQEDFQGTVTAIRRLQETYNIPPSTIASGKLGSTSAIPMSAEDAYVIGRESYNQQHWEHSRQWMREALDRFDNGDGSEVDVVDVLDHLAFNEYQLGNMKRAAQYTEQLLQNEPEHLRGQSNLRFFNDIRDSQPEEFVDGEEAGEGGEELTELLDQVYKQTCREGRPASPEDHHKLTCFYWTNNRNPRLVIRPAKVEVVFPEPKIYILRDIISEPEMARLKELAEPKLQRAKTKNLETGNGETVDNRISKSGWLPASDDPLGYVSRIDQRIGDVTGLSMETAEWLQVVNYGIGGQYEPHYDFFRRDGDFESVGNRIATVLFYLSDVELGGATAFTILGARIPPTKGDAVFWWNLKKSGKGDYFTMHAGCPVLVGSKWVCNKWIHERGQEFRRPCGLSPDD